jgi:predicted transcriptional regulator
MITTIDIRNDLWEKAKILAVKEKSDLKAIVNEALKEYLERKVKKGGKKK